MSAHHHVFVFGTLKEGFPNFAVNRGVRLPGTFTTRQRYPLFLVGERFVPWLLDQPGQGHRVMGQVFEVDDATLAAMDALERVAAADGYRRARIEVAAADATAHPVWAYLKPAEQVEPSTIRLGPLDEYTLAHAARYRSRGPDAR